jgi:ABC-type glycerol-3-phosphate transport system permease component
MNIITIKRKVGTTVILIVCVAYTVIISYPFLWTLVMSFRPSDQILDNPYGLAWPPYSKNYIYAFTKFNFPRYLFNSTFVTITALVITATLTSLAAYGFARRRYRFPLREPIYWFIFISIMFPPQITLLALYQVLVKYGLYNTLWGLIPVYSVSAFPFNIYVLRSFFAQIPQDLEDAARIDGCSDWALFWKVMFPIARPAIATTIVVNGIDFWNEFLYATTFIFRQEARTLPLAVMFFVGEGFANIGMMACGLIISALPLLILYSILSEQFIKGMSAGALKG